MNSVEVLYSPQRPFQYFNNSDGIKKTHQWAKVLNSTEEVELANILTWREKTSLPIVKVLSFKTQNNQQWFPKTFDIQLESIKRTIEDIHDIELPYSIFLLQQFSLGVHALCYKYGKFDLEKLFFGFNEKGECRVWLSNNLMEWRPKEILLPVEQTIIIRIFKIVESVCNRNCKIRLNSILNQIMMLPHLRFIQFSGILDEFIKINSIKVPNSIQVEDLSSSFLASTSFTSKKSLTPSKINFKYKSPNPKNVPTSPLITTCSFITTNTSITSSQTMKSQSNKIKANGPFIHFRYDNLEPGLSSLGNSIVSSPTCSSKSSSIQQWQNTNNLITMKSMYQPTNSIVFSSQITKENNQIDKDSYFKVPLTESEMINKDEINKISNSFTFTNLVSNSVGSKTHNITQETQSQITNNKEYHYTVCSPSIQTQESNYGKYNFGGLIPLQEESIKHEIMNESSPNKVTELFESVKYLSSLENSSSSVIRSIILSQSNVKESKINQTENIKTEWDFGNKMDKLFIYDDQDLKESVYCGEEKKAELLPIKLELLGKLGRNIAASNVMHEEC